MRKIAFAGLSSFLCLFAFAQTPTITANKTTATITVDGNLNEAAWITNTAVTKAIIGTPNNTTVYGVMWNNTYLYVGIKVTDANLFNESTNNYDDDAVEIYIDADNNGGTTYGTNDRQFIKEYNSTTIWEKASKTTGVLHGWAAISGGYTMEIAIPWSNIGITGPAAGRIVGFDVGNDDDDNGGARESQAVWAGDANNWQYPRNFGDLVLANAPDVQAPTAPTALSATAIYPTNLTLNWTASTDNVGVTGYDVYRNGTKINTALVTTTTYAATGLAASTAYSFYVVARDAANNQSANSNTVSLSTPSATPCAGTGGIRFQKWINVTGTAVSNLTSLATYPNSPNSTGTLTSFEIPSAAGDNYGMRLTGLICPPATGSYTFWIASDDASELWLSTNSNPTSKVKIAYQTTWTNSREWNKFTTQKSAAITLVAGQTYYVEALMKDGTGGDNLAVGWAKPGQATTTPSEVIPGANLISQTADTQAPTAATNLAATNITLTTFTLSWTAATDNVGVTGYDVFQNGVKINTANVTATNFAVSGLTQGTTYAYYVVARDAAGNLSANSTTLNVTTASPDVQAPTVPAGLASASVTQTSFTLSWTASTDNVGVTGYDVFQDNVKISTANITATNFAVSGLTPSTSYAYTVVAKDAAGNISASSNPLTVTTDAPDTQAPVAPADLQAASITQSSLTLNWTAATDNVGVTGYDVFQDGIQINAQNITATSFTVTGLTAATSYNFYVVAKDAAGNLSQGSASLDISTTAPDIDPPTVPVNLTATNLGLTLFRLNWNASTDNTSVAGYDVYKNGTKINSSLVVGTNYSVTGLTPGSTNTFTVVAVDGLGNASSPSNGLDVTTLLPNPGTETFTQRTVIGNQRMPHDLVYGPDNNIWYTERFSGTVSYVNPATGAKTVVLNLGSKLVRVGGQDGLLGLALHPQFLTGKPYVYISYTYQSTSSTVRKTRVERYTYDFNTKTLGAAVTVLENIPGSNDHNSARIAIGPDLKLYYTVGDMGAGQFDNLTRTQNAQNLNVYEGKVLRLNTEAIGGSWIPTDNPFTNAGVPTAVYSWGHRNAQGLVWGKVNGVDILYNSEHGPYSDDEINLIERGRNYGWPKVVGFCDGNYNGRTIGTFAVVNEQQNCIELNVKEPLKSLFPSPNPPQEGTDNMTWPSTAPSGTDFYGSTAIPGWQNSLLVAELKDGTIARFKLSNDGTNIISDTINYFRGKGRFRDVVVSPDGTKIYVACDSSGTTCGPTGNVVTTPANPGSILEFTYVPPSGLRNGNAVATNATVAEVLDNRSIDVYPNPATTYIVVYNYEDVQGRTIELMDLGGRMVKKVQVTSMATRIETGKVSNGLYILKVLDKKGKLLRLEKVVINK